MRPAPEPTHDRTTHRRPSEAAEEAAHEQHVMRRWPHRRRRRRRPTPTPAGRRRGRSSSGAGRARVRSTPRSGCGGSAWASSCSASWSGWSARAVFATSPYALDRAEDDTEQLVRVQKIQTNLLRADATATNAFLVGGLEPPAQRAAYDEALAEVQRADRRGRPGPAGRRRGAGRAQPQGRRLRRRHRAGPGQQPAGAARSAPSTSAAPAPGSAADALPILDNLVERERRPGRPTQMDVRVGYLAVVLALLGLAGLVAGPGLGGPALPPPDQPGLLAASAVVLLGRWSARGRRRVQQLASSVAATRERQLRRREQRRPRPGSQANNAKSNESLTLIARGSGASVREGLGRPRPSWSTGSARDSGRPAGSDRPVAGLHRRAHQDPRPRRRRPLGRGRGPGHRRRRRLGQRHLRARSTTALTGYLDEVSTATSTASSRPQPGLVIGAVLTLLAGLAAARARHAAASPQRLREYR